MSRYPRRTWRSVKMNFEELNLAPAIMQAVRELGYETPTPIQAQAIPAVLAGQDLLAGAQTGTGKTAAFALPLLSGLWMDSYLDLDSAQRARLKDQLRSWTAWHRREELPQWQALLRQIDAAEPIPEPLLALLRTLAERSSGG